MILRLKRPFICQNVATAPVHCIFIASVRLATRGVKSTKLMLTVAFLKSEVMHQTWMLLKMMMMVVMIDFTD